MKKYIKWQDKYNKAITEKKNLIGDAIMRDTYYKIYPNAITEEECRFPEFQADIVEFYKWENDFRIIGWEIKSDRDSLDRLSKQLSGYLKYFNYVIVLATLRHKKELLKILTKPEYERVGVKFYFMTDQGNTYINFRYAKFSSLKDLGISTDFISKHNKLYRWKYWLNEVYGGDR